MRTRTKAATTAPATAGPPTTAPVHFGQAPPRADPTVRRMWAFVDRPTTIAGAGPTHGRVDVGPRAVVRPTDDARIHDGWSIASGKTGVPVDPTVDGGRSELPRAP